MRILPPTTLRRSRPSQTVHQSTGAPGLTWGREGPILTLPSCIRALAGMLLAMQSPPMVTQNRCFSHRCLLGTQVGGDCSTHFFCQQFYTAWIMFFHTYFEPHPASSECILEISDRAWTWPFIFGWVSTVHVPQSHMARCLSAAMIHLLTSVIGLMRRGHRARTVCQCIWIIGNVRSNNVKQTGMMMMMMMMMLFTEIQTVKFGHVYTNNGHLWNQTGVRT
jgi:hypothetical protein